MKKILKDLSQYLKRAKLYNEYNIVLKLAGIDSGSGGAFSRLIDLNSKYSPQQIADDDSLYEEFYETFEEGFNSFSDLFDKKEYELNECASNEDCNFYEVVDSFNESLEDYIEYLNAALRTLSIDELPEDIKERIEQLDTMSLNRPNYNHFEGHKLYDEKITWNTRHKSHSLKEKENTIRSYSNPLSCDKILEDWKSSLNTLSDEDYLNYMGCFLMNNLSPEKEDFIFNIEDKKIESLKSGWFTTPDVSQVDVSKDEINRRYKRLTQNQKNRLLKALS